MINDKKPKRNTERVRKVEENRKMSSGIIINKFVFLDSLTLLFRILRTK